MRAKTTGRIAITFAHVADTGIILVVLPQNKLCFVAVRIVSALQGEDGCWPIQVSHSRAWFDARYHPVSGDIIVYADENQFLGAN